MNRRLDFDQLMREWVDAGEDRLPIHHLHGALAAIDTTRQRGARRALLEDVLMRLQPLAAPLAIAAVLAVAIGAAAIVSQPAPIGPTPSATDSPPPTTPTIAPSATIEPTPTLSPTATAQATLDFGALEGEWEGTIRRGGAGGLEFRIVAVIRAAASTGSPVARVTHYQGAQSEPFCEGDWFALAADHPAYQVSERMGDEACNAGTVDLTHDPDTGVLSYSFRADHGAAAGFATGELSRVAP